jgi:signal transduction histidine kinase
MGPVWRKTLAGDGSHSAGEIAAELNRSGFRLNDLPVEMGFVAGNGAGGEWLGEEFSDLRVTFRGSDENALRNTWNTPRSFYLIALFLVLSVTRFGSYLLWYDVRRELRMADLRSQFVSSVSHELKTPLTSIRMFAETLRLGRVPDRRVEVEYLETIVAESERLTRLLNNILDFSKIEQGTKSYRLHPTSLAEVARASIQALEHPLAQQGFDLHVDLDGDLPAINADRDSLEQAILNLLTNAMKYSGESRRISLRLSRQNGDAVIEVGDSGLGIAPEEQHRVFDKFYRGSAPEIGLIAGTGLGLTLVAHIARAHGGRVKVQSEPGNGSTFFIHIPLEIEP